MAISTRATATEAEYCLRGEVGGIEESFPLPPGVSRVGSLEANDICLPRRGVSRHHARLTLTGGELLVEDLGSKNGTFIDGRRVEKSRTHVGGGIRFGPVELAFERFHQEDADLAITLDPAVSDQTSTIPIIEAPAAGAGAGLLSRHWLRLAEAFHARLYGKEDGDMGAALRLLLEELHLHSACVMEMPADAEAVVLAASGHLASEAAEVPQRFLASVVEGENAGSQDIHFHTEPAGNNPCLTLAVLTGVEADPLALALWGAFPGRSESELMLRLLVRMLAPCRPRTAPESGESRLRRYPGLVVPPGYVYAQSAKMAKIYERMQILAQGDLPILITGETGVGKEHLANILHHSSPRRRGPFVAINCAAIPAEMLEAELFGIGDKVATGVAGSKGRLQLANGGTLFLDEIGDMSADLQAKLLRALQEKEVHPVGREPVTVDVRVVAATNQQLKQRIADGTFRADLYYRLAGYVLEIPPLRERPADIPALTEYFLRECAREIGRPIRGLTVRALQLLTEYPWPGNVRELQNEVRRAVYLCPENGTIDSSIISESIRSSAEAGSEESAPELPPAEPAAHVPPKFSLDEDDESQLLPAPMGLGLDSLNLDHLESQAVKEALRRCRQNQVQAAKLLGISRQSLRRRMERMGEL